MTLRCSVCNSVIVRNRLGPSPKTCSSPCRQISYRQRKMAQGFVLYRGYFYSSPDAVGQESTVIHPEFLDLVGLSTASQSEINKIFDKSDYPF